MASRGINKVILLGNVGNDPDVRTTQDGKAIANISLATTQSWRGKDGRDQEKTEWHKVVFFEPLASIVERYVQKGSKLYIEGSLKTRSFEQDGVKRYMTEIAAKDMQMLDSKTEVKESSEDRSPRQIRPTTNRRGY
jgi:single-strand DNA-binding protein|tara:strand:- start:134 stop:541 length:408 start_codon:yes stop_codon:yes gene_type:complete